MMSICCSLVALWFLNSILASFGFSGLISPKDLKGEPDFEITPTKSTKNCLQSIQSLQNFAQMKNAAVSFYIHVCISHLPQKPQSLRHRLIKMIQCKYNQKIQTSHLL